MTRINIHVPVDLEALFTQYKDQINVSQAALRCVKAELEQAEKVAQGLITTDAIVQRLRMERFQAEDDVFQLGYSQGVEYFEKKPYGAIQAIVEEYLKGNAEGIMDAAGDEDEFGGYSRGRMFQFWANGALGIKSHQLQHFAFGYGKATKDCWEKIESQVMA